MDRLTELFDTLRTAKLRTAVTALSVAWGIFMLVILLGAGRGIQNGAEHEFRDDATNSLWVWRGTTSMPWQGHKPGRRVRLDSDDIDAIQRSVEGVEHMTGRFYLPGEYTTSFNGVVASFEVRAVHPGHRYLENTSIREGRFLNPLDLSERRKVAVIGPAVVTRLFKDVNPLGEWLEIGGRMYRVVGVFEDAGGEEEEQKIYIPITTAQMVYGAEGQVNQIMFTLGGGADVESSKRAIADTTKVIASHHNFSPKDKRALRVRNTLEDFQRVAGLFAKIRTFIWIVGVGTIIAGIVGVSNIMLISVRERTKEIGIRKALGATPWTIVSQVLLESLVVTGVSGYSGLVLGLATLELAKWKLPPTDFFRDPQADLGVVVGATLLLVFSGLLAGYFPASLAAKVSPSVALRAE
jgi:putative ABC transport system permease protein